MTTRERERELNEIMAEEAKEKPDRSYYWWENLDLDLKDAYIKEGTNQLLGTLSKSEEAKGRGEEEQHMIADVMGSIIRFLLDNPEVVQEINKLTLREQNMLSEMGSEKDIEAVRNRLSPQ